MGIEFIVLAAGMGKRMNSQKPKVMHRIAGKPLLMHVLTIVKKFTGKPMVVCGHSKETLFEAFANENIQWVVQQEQLGTGHAVLESLPLINENDQVVILNGDVPLISEETISKLITDTKADELGMVTAILTDPYGYGRIIRDLKNDVVKIVEEKDATAVERLQNEINTGIYCISAKMLKDWLPKLERNNQQKEYYLTDIVKLALENKVPIKTIIADENEIRGVNDQIQLAHLERIYQNKMALLLMKQGVILLDPKRIDVRGHLTVGEDVVIDCNVIIEGDVSIGNNCYIGPNCVLKNVKLMDNIRIDAFSFLEDAIIENGCNVGPYARLRPGTKLSNEVHIGNFVEIKNSDIGANTKINHLSYIGDSIIGKKVNVGAGTITCNYDGVHKHQTIIEDNVFIGSDTQLVAPVKIGEGSIIGAGSTVIHDTPRNKLTLTQRIDQRVLENWSRDK